MVFFNIYAQPFIEFCIGLGAMNFIKSFFEGKNMKFEEKIEAGRPGGQYEGPINTSFLLNSFHI